MTATEAIRRSITHDEIVHITDPSADDWARAE